MAYKYRVSCFMSSDEAPKDPPALMSVNYTSNLTNVAQLLEYLENGSGVCKIVVDTSLEGG